MNKNDYQLIDFERGNTDHRVFTEKVVLANYNDRYTATELPLKRAEDGIFNSKIYSEDFSKIVLINGEKVGLFVLVHCDNEPAWELGLFHILPEFQKKGLGSRLLEEIENNVKNSPWPSITMKAHSRHSLMNGIPALRADVLSFFTKRGFWIKSKANGAYIITPAQFSYNEEKLDKSISKNMADGYQALDVLVEDANYESLVTKAIDLCRREKNLGWERFLTDNYSLDERTGVSVVQKDGEVVAFAAYNFVDTCPTIWGVAPQWGPLLTSSEHRGRGLANWIIRNSLKQQFAKGAEEVILWTGVAGMASKIYEKFGFRLLCPWFLLEKDMVMVK